MKDKFLVFDFDGTLADTKSLYLNVIHNALLKHDYNIDKKEINKKLGPVLKILLINLGVKKKDIIPLSKEVNRVVTKQANNIKLCPYAKQTIEELSKECSIVLITNSVRPFIYKILKRYNLIKYFSELYCARFKIKDNGFREVFKKYRVRAKDVVYVADTAEDVAIAKRVGCKIIIPLACSWDKEKLKTKKFAIKSLKELSGVI